LERIKIIRIAQTVIKLPNYVKMKNERNFTGDKPGQMVPMETSLATMQGPLVRKTKVENQLN